MSLAAILDPLWARHGRVNDAPAQDDVADFPSPVYSRKQVVKAGKALCEPMPAENEDDPRLEYYRSVFKVAYDWRSSHAYPMRRLREDLRSRIREMKRDGLTVARLKRMTSIRKKLERLNTTLAQIQDIGGCRAIVDTQETLDGLLVHYRSKENPHSLRLDRSYIDNPRDSGYRSHHLVFDFKPQSKEEDPFLDRRIEVQLRSRIQHSWATAVEAIGLYRNEDLKASEGNADWLNFFRLVSAEFAHFEGGGEVPDVPGHQARISEIRRLDRKLDAVKRLETLNQSFHYVEKNSMLGARYFLVRFDYSGRRIDVEGYDRITRASDQYGYEERSHANLNAVVVEADTIKELKEAYPNYFLDVRLFTENVMHVMHGEHLVSSLKRVDTAKTAQGFDIGWLRKHFPGMMGRS